VWAVGDGTGEVGGVRARSIIRGRCACCRIGVMVIRVGRVSDAAGIGLVHVRSWQTAYEGLMPQEYLNGLDPVRRGSHWARRLGDTPQPGQVVLIADVDGAVVGFASLGPSRDDDAQGVGELYAIYLLPGCWGQGLGRDLMTASLQTMHRAAFTEATLWVLNTNERARRFYTASGWTLDEVTRQDDTHGFPLNEVRYRHCLP
jgi:GNAT superfamily N-acetyltransferase